MYNDEYVTVDKLSVICKCWNDDYSNIQRVEDDISMNGNWVYCPLIACVGLTTNKYL